MFASVPAFSTAPTSAFSGGLGHGWSGSWVGPEGTESEGLTISGELADEATVALVAENLPPGTLTVSKVLANATPGQTFGFEATLTNADDTPFVGAADYTIAPAQPGSVTITSPAPQAAGDDPYAGTIELTEAANGLVRFDLAPGATLALTDLPTGTNFRVLEVRTGGYYPRWSASGGAVVSGNGVSGAITTSNLIAEVTATNSTSPSGDASLTVGKRVFLAEGQRLDPNAVYDITVELANRAINGRYGAMDFADGVASLTLHPDQTLTASGLPRDVRFTITENGVRASEVTWSANGPVSVRGATVTGTLQGQALNIECDNVLGGNHKIETTPGDGETVKAGDLVTYQIFYENDTNQTRDIRIIDAIDVGADFMQASHGGSYDANAILPDDLAVGYDYHGVVSWVVPNVGPGAKGYVTLTVRVNRNAYYAGEILNQAFVRVGNGPWHATEIPRNPTGLLVPKTEDTTMLTLAIVLAVVGACVAAFGVWLVATSRRRHPGGGGGRRRS